jgi:ribonuclease VapC
VTVLDASALLAYLHGEPGAPAVREAMMTDALVCAVNLAETLSKLCDEGHDPEEVMDRIGALPFDVVPFDEADDIESALLRATTATVGLSLGDRACLAVARRLGRRVLTTDRAWLGLVPGLDVELIR